MRSTIIARIFHSSYISSMVNWRFLHLFTLRSFSCTSPSTLLVLLEKFTVSKSRWHSRISLTMENFKFSSFNLNGSNDFCILLSIRSKFFEMSSLKGKSWTFLLNLGLGRLFSTSSELIFVGGELVDVGLWWENCFFSDLGLWFNFLFFLNIFKNFKWVYLLLELVIV